MRLKPSRATTTVVPLVVYFAFAVLWIGRNVLVHPQSRVVGDRFVDKTIFMWAFSWWPHAIAHGHDPFDAHVIWAPHGVDLAWVTAAPGLSLALTPLTETLGPVFAYNVAAIAAPALAAWTAYLLARRLTRSVPASLVAGFLFGFSPYVMGQDSSHLNLSFVCLIPVVGLLAVAYVQRDVGRWKYVGLLGLTLAFQFCVSTEIFATLAVVGAITIVLAFTLLPTLRRLIALLAGYTVLGYGVAAVLVTPYLVHIFAGSSTPPRRGHTQGNLDLLNLVVPTRKTWVRPPGSQSLVNHFTSNGSEQGGYLSVPLIVMLVLGAIALRGVRRRGYWVLLAGLVAADVLALGSEVRVDGHGISPWLGAWLAKVPDLGEAVTIRFDMYAALFAALAAGLWLARPGGRRGWSVALGTLAVVALLPSPAAKLWVSDVPQSTFFDSSAYRSYLHPGETTVVFPYGASGWSMLWQAETGFDVSMIGGHVGRNITRPECRWYWDYRALSGAVVPPGGAAEFRRFLLAHHVGAIVEGPGTRAWSLALIAASLPDVRGVQVRDATVLRIPPTLPVALPKGGPPIPPKPKKNHPNAPECYGIAPAYPN